MKRKAPLSSFVLFGAIFAGLNPAHALVIEDTLVINATTGDDVIVVEDAGAGATTITVNGTASTMANPPELLTINGLAGNDSITIFSLAGDLPGSGFGASFIFDGGPDADSVIIGGDLMISDDDENTDELFRLVGTETVDIGHAILAGSQIELDGDVTVTGAPAVLSAEFVTINGLLDGSTAADFEIVGNLSLMGNVGSTSPFNSLTVSGETVAGQGVDLIRTRGNQTFEDSIQLATNAALVSADAAGALRNGRLQFNGITATGHDLVMSSQGRIQLIGGTPTVSILYDIGFISVDAGELILSTNLLLRLNSTEDIEINAPTRIGARARTRIEQQGSGDIVFLDTLGRTSGGPHNMALLNQSGDVVFNGDVSTGELIIEAGDADNQLRINASSIRTTGGNGNSGQMLIDTPITLLNNTTLTATNGEMQINGDIDSAGFFTVFETTDTRSALNGQITGAFSKEGPGDLRITSSGNRVAGLNFVVDGRLLVDGEFLAELNPLPNFAKSVPIERGFEVGSGGVLGGDGLLDVLVAVIGTINPGDNTGTLTISAVEFLGGTLAIDINDFGAGTGFDQLVITESISLSDTTLDIQGGFLAKGLGLELIIVDNRSGSPVSGTFVDLPEGTFIDDDQTLRITYVGGDGNDIAIIDDRPSSQVIFVDGFEAFDNVNDD